MTLALLIILITVSLFVYYFLKKPGEQLVCTRCNTVGDPVSKTKGSFLIEVLLWLCFIIPGVIYSVWRLSSRGKVCSSCGSAELVSQYSPKGRLIVEGKA